MKRIVDIPDKVVEAIQNGEDYRYDIHTAIAQSTPYNPTGDAISREDLINAKPEFLNEKVVRDTKYQTIKSRIYAKAWNACNSEWLNTIKNAPTVDIKDQIAGAYNEGYMCGNKEAEKARPQGEWKTVKGIDGDEYYECSNCGEPWVLMTGTPKDNNMNFCPACGANMRKGGAE